VAYLVDLKTFTDKRGNLTVIEKVIPFEVRRIFYIYGVDASVRGGHRHHNTLQAAICIKGECKIYNNDAESETTFHLSRPDQCLILEPKDWHQMFDFSEDAILMVLASQFFDASDYIFDKYE
jgi:dTDP-4-dehydrorhamnose 3,5-epimerase-like enzyme